MGSGSGEKKTKSSTGRSEEDCVGMDVGRYVNTPR